MPALQCVGQIGAELAAQMRPPGQAVHACEGKHPSRATSWKVDPELSEGTRGGGTKLQFALAIAPFQGTNVDQVIKQSHAQLSGQMVVAGGGGRDRSSQMGRSAPEPVEHREDLAQSGLGQRVHR